MANVVKAAGLVIYRDIAGKIEYLLLQASYPPYHWTPPKGHVDPGEDEWTAALRETKEEANLNPDQLIIHEDIHETLYYKANNKDKSVKYWLAQLKSSEEVKLSNEHQNWKWSELEETCKLADFAETGKLFRKFAGFITK